MSYKLNPFTGKFDNVGSFVIPSGASDPASGAVGQMFLNTANSKIKVYYAGVWVDLHTIDGIGIMVIGTTFTIA